MNLLCNDKHLKGFFDPAKFQVQTEVFAFFT